MAMGKPYLGSRISVTDGKSIRYEGTLYHVDIPKAKIVLRTVRVHGTEGRSATVKMERSAQIFNHITVDLANIQDARCLGCVGLCCQAKSRGKPDLREFLLKLQRWAKSQRSPDITSVCHTLVLADARQDMFLKRSSINFIAENMGELYGTDEWKTLKDTHPELVEEVLMRLSEDEEDSWEFDEGEDEEEDEEEEDDVSTDESDPDGEAGEWGAAQAQQQGVRRRRPSLIGGEETGSEQVGVRVDPVGVIRVQRGASSDGGATEAGGRTPIGRAAANRSGGGTPIGRDAAGGGGESGSGNGRGSGSGSGGGGDSGSGSGSGGASEGGRRKILAERRSGLPVEEVQPLKKAKVDGDAAGDEQSRIDDGRDMLGGDLRSAEHKVGDPRPSKNEIGDPRPSEGKARDPRLSKNEVADPCPSKNEVGDPCPPKNEVVRAHPSKNEVGDPRPSNNEDGDETLGEDPRPAEKQEKKELSADALLRLSPEK